MLFVLTLVVCVVFILTKFLFSCLRYLHYLWIIDITFIKGNRLLLGGKTEAPAVEQKTGQLNAAEDKTGYGKTTSGDIHVDYARTVAEIQKLREEESQLRMENIELKVGR